MSEIKTSEEVKRNNKTTDLDETRDTKRETVGLAGEQAHKAIDPTEEEAYWKEKYKTRTYYNEGREYDAYATAFHYGWETAAKPENAGRKFEDIEAELEKGWPSYEGSNQNTWRDAKDAIRDAYNRIRTLK